MSNENYGTGLYQDGVFYFTNPTKEDWSVLWNNKEYTFKANTTVPLVIANEPPENIQSIRKKFAKKLSQHVFHQSKEYKDMVKKGGYIPATYDEDTVLEKVIQQCLTPLPKSSAVVREMPRDKESNYKGSKAISDKTDLNRAFQDYEIPTLGAL